MLAELHVKDFAIIESVRADFSPGFNVITGETGAGKTIFVEALTALTGSRLETGQIRHGAEHCLVEARFRVGRDGSDLFASRSFHRLGRSRCRLNGSSCTVGHLTSTVRSLVHYQGQHEAQRLFDREEQLRLLDSFGGEAVSAMLKSYAAEYERFLTVSSALKALDTDEKARARETERLRHEVAEIEAAGLNEAEMEEIEKDLQVARNAGRIAEALMEAEEACAGEGEGGSARDLVFTSLRGLTSLNGIDDELDGLSSELEGIGIRLDEAAAAMRCYREGMAFDPKRLADLEDRQSEIAGLRRRYGDTYEEIEGYLAEARARLQALGTEAGSADELAAERVSLLRSLDEGAASLTEERDSAARRLEAAMEPELAALGLEKTRLEIELSSWPTSENEGFGPRGRDAVDLLFSPNPGEPLRPLRKIASGGELSRFMLALQSALAADAPPLTLIFDEVDSGIGGGTAIRIGERLRKLAQRTQVICITHLPQIAALADRHFYITKAETGERTVTHITLLEDDDRLAEIARMISGDEDSSASLEQARSFFKVGPR